MTDNRKNAGDEIFVRSDVRDEIVSRKIIVKIRKVEFEIFCVGIFEHIGNIEVKISLVQQIEKRTVAIFDI